MTEVSGRTGGPALGDGLRLARTRKGLSLREVSRRVGISPSLLSQIENHKVQPSVATLYSLSEELEVTVDSLFALGGPANRADGGVRRHTETPSDDHDRVVMSPASAGAGGGQGTGRSVVAAIGATEALSGSSSGAPQMPDERGRRGGRTAAGRIGPRHLSFVPADSGPTIELDSGVRWEQLATLHDAPVEFLKITYYPGGGSTAEGRLTTHGGVEFGYLLTGRLLVRLGFDVCELAPGDSIAYHSSTPHRLECISKESAVALWCVVHPK